MSLCMSGLSYGLPERLQILWMYGLPEPRSSSRLRSLVDEVPTSSSAGRAPEMPKSRECRATRPRATACTTVAARRRAASSSSSSSVIATPTAARGEKRLANQPTAASTSPGSAASPKASPSAAILRSSRAAVASPHVASQPTALWRWCAAAAAASAASAASPHAAWAAASSSTHPSSRASANSPTDRWYAIHCARSGLPAIGGSADGGLPVIVMARPYAPST